MNSPVAIARSGTGLVGEKTDMILNLSALVRASYTTRVRETYERQRVIYRPNTSTRAIIPRSSNASPLSSVHRGYNRHTAQTEGVRV